MACNMRCTHCGSSCATALPGELTTQEALDLCGQIADLGVQRVTLSGGEPLLRADWPTLADALVRRGVRVTMISNGWLLSRDAVERARQAGVNLIAVSLDGLEPTHDSIRRPGSFRKVIEALALMQAEGFPAGVITTLIKRNLPELPALRDLLLELRPKTWQLQIGRAMGNLSGHPGDWLTPSDTPPVLEFAADVARRTPLVVDLADCLGYYTTQNQHAAASRGEGASTWMGCHAGRRAFGIRHDGAISACNSIRDVALEGSVRDTPLERIWNRTGAFDTFRSRSRDTLTGVCRECQFGEVCLAGCTSVRRTLSRSDGEYPHCAYLQSIEPLFAKIARMQDPSVLVRKAALAADLHLLDVAARCLARALQLDPHDAAAVSALAEVERRLGRTVTGTGVSQRH
jgi:radical SAM protein with 4Fe4S-binding SPASM domain